MWLVLNRPRPRAYFIEARRRRPEPSYEPWQYITTLDCELHSDEDILESVYELFMGMAPEYDWKVSAVW
jgi:hypothetical protein